MILHYAKENGFSLPEFLFVFLLLAGISAWASLCLGQQSSQFLLLRSSKTLVGLLNHKSLQAFIHGRNVYLILDQDRGEIRECSKPPQSNADLQQGQLLLTLPRGVRFGEIRLPDLRFTKPFLLFTPSGFSSPGTIELRRESSEERCLLVQASGGRRNLHCLRES